MLGETEDPCRDTSAPTAITPQGLLARFSTTGDAWACLTLARLGAIHVRVEATSPNVPGPTLPLGQVPDVPPSGGTGHVCV